MSFPNESNNDNSYFMDTNRILYSDSESSNCPSLTPFSDETEFDNNLYTTQSYHMNWQQSVSHQMNNYNTMGNMDRLDNCLQSENYQIPASSSITYNNISNPDISGQFDSSFANNYQMVYTPTSVDQPICQIQQIQPIVQTTYQFEVKTEEKKLMDLTHSSATSVDLDLSVSQTVNQMTDSVQTLDTNILNNDSSQSMNNQFMKTIEFLKATNLLELTLQTADMMKKSFEIQREINKTKNLLSRFMSGS